MHHTIRVPRVKPSPSKETLSKRARNAKAKGKAWEREIAAQIAEAISLPIEDVYNARSGKKECDIQLSTEARNRFPHHVECKNHKTLAIPQWIRQMENDIKVLQKAGTPHGVGIVVFKQHGDRTPYAVVRFDHLLRLLTKGR